MKEALPSQSVLQDAGDRRAKDGKPDMLLAVPGRLATVEPVVGGGLARPKLLATACPADRHPFRPRQADRDHLAAGCRRLRRLPRLLLLPGGPGERNMAYPRAMTEVVESAPAGCFARGSPAVDQYSRSQADTEMNSCIQMDKNSIRGVVTVASCRGREYTGLARCQTTLRSCSDARPERL